MVVKTTAQEIDQVSGVMPGQFGEVLANFLLTHAVGQIE